MLRLVDHEVLEAWPTHFQIEFAGDEQHRVAHRFGLEFATVCAPQVAVVGVHFLESGHARGILAIRRAGHDQLVQRLERLTAIAELGGQPVEQFRMRRQPAHAPEIIRRLDQTSTEVILPDSIDGRTPGQRIVASRQPLREGGAALAFGVIRREFKPRRQSGQTIQGARPDFLPRLLNAATIQHINGSRLAALGPRACKRTRPGVNRRHVGCARCRQFAQFGLHGSQIAFHLGQRVLVADGRDARDQPITILAQCGQLTAVRPARARLPAIGQIQLLPTHRRLDGIERGDDGTERHVVAVRSQRVQLRQRKDVVVLPQRELRRRHADEPRRASARIDAERLELGIRDVFLGVIAHQRHAVFEGRVVRCLNFEPHWKTKTFANAVEVVLARMQHDAAEGNTSPQIHLHPLRDVLVLLNVAMVAVRIAFLRGLRQRGNLLVEINERLARAGENLSVQFLPPRCQRSLSFRQLLAFLRHDRIDVILLVRTIHGGEHRLQAVVIFLRDGIELVIVALRALHGHAVKRLHRARHHVIAVQMPRDHAVHLRLRHLGVSDEIPRPRRDEPERLEAIARPRKQHIARQLLLHETRVGLVLVEAADDVIAIGPGIRARLILVVAVRLAVVNDVQPVPRPALAVLRRREQSFHQLLVSLRVLVRRERLDLVRLRRQADEIEIHAANQRPPLRFRRLAKSFLAEFRDHERIHRVHHSCPAGFHCGHRRLHERFERPPVGLVHRLANLARDLFPVPLRALINPRAQKSNLPGRESLPLALGRHLHVRHQSRDVMHERTFGAVAGDDVHAVIATGQCMGARVEAEPVLRFLRSVTLHAGGLEQRLDVPREIHAIRRRRRGQPGRIQSRCRDHHRWRPHDHEESHRRNNGADKRPSSAGGGSNQINA